MAEDDRVVRVPAFQNLARPFVASVEQPVRFLRGVDWRDLACCRQTRS